MWPVIRTWFPFVQRSIICTWFPIANHLIPLARNQPTLISIIQGPDTNAAINFKRREDVKHSVATGSIRTWVRIGVLITSRPLAHHPVVIMNYLLNRISLIWTPDLFLLYDYIFIYWTHRWNLEKMKMGVFKILPKILVVC